jgi:hypothetical protein
VLTCSYNTKLSWKNQALEKNFFSNFYPCLYTVANAPVKTTTNPVSICINSTFARDIFQCLSTTYPHYPQTYPQKEHSYLPFLASYQQFSFMQKILYHGKKQQLDKK